MPTSNFFWEGRSIIGLKRLSQSSILCWFFILDFGISNNSEALALISASKMYAGKIPFYRSAHKIQNSPTFPGKSVSCVWLICLKYCMYIGLRFNFVSLQNNANYIAESSVIWYMQHNFLCYSKWILFANIN